MNELIDELDEWMNEWIKNFGSKWMNEWVDRCMDG